MYWVGQKFIQSFPLDPLHTCIIKAKYFVKQYLHLFLVMLPCILYSIPSLSFVFIVNQC